MKYNWALNFQNLCQMVEMAMAELVHRNRLLTSELSQVLCIFSNFSSFFSLRVSSTRCSPQAPPSLPPTLPPSHPCTPSTVFSSHPTSLFSPES